MFKHIEAFEYYLLNIITHFLYLLTKDFINLILNFSKSVHRIILILLLKHLNL